MGKGRSKWLKALDTFGNNCQRPVFSLCVSQHMHKITNLWKFLTHQLVVEDLRFQMLDFETSANILVENYFLLENNITSEGAVSYNV